MIAPERQPRPGGSRGLLPVIADLDNLYPGVELYLRCGLPDFFARVPRAPGGDQNLMVSLKRSPGALEAGSGGYLGRGWRAGWMHESTTALR